MIARYENLFEGLQFKSSFAIQHNAMFVIRRYVLIFIIVVFPSYGFS